MSDSVHLAFQIVRLPCPHCAVVLLAVLILGLLITALTQGWLAGLPAHDHLVAGFARGRGGTTRHIHRGDALARAEAALTPVMPAMVRRRVGVGGPPRDATDHQRIVSFRDADDAQPDSSSVTFAGALDRAPGAASAAPTFALLAEEPVSGEGRSQSPLAPPPRKD